MTKAAWFTAAIAGFALISTAVAQDRMVPLDDLPLAEGEFSFVVDEGEATVNDDMIRRIAIGREEVTATYRNRTSERKRAKYTIELYNKYGLLLGEDKAGDTIFGGTGSIEPGDVGTERFNVKWLPLDRLFKKSSVPLPADWRVAKWVVIKDTNTRSE
ncbi:MAG: hypothetical protein JJ992_28640 [Planctomycetes bacterium]|nr:hypothetical protein [Planctomycetota bacterium]